MVLALKHSSLRPLELVVSKCAGGVKLRKLDELENGSVQVRYSAPDWQPRPYNHG